MKPIAIFLSVRNRLAVTKKCIEALYKYTTCPFHLYVYDNCTTYKVAEHFKYFGDLYVENKITKYTVNTLESTYYAFSKAVAFNDFGHTIQQNPIKNRYDYYVCLDNDIIIRKEGWNDVFKDLWKAVACTEELDSIRVLAQFPGGTTVHQKGTIDDYKVNLGFASGSGFWAIRSDFFDTIGFLNLAELVGHNKKHDQLYWKKMRAYNSNAPYVLAVEELLAVHFDNYKDYNSLSICLPTQDDPSMTVVHEDVEEEIAAMTFEDFEILLNDNVDRLRIW